MLGPIFIREWLILPRRSRHYFTRSLYLGGFWILLCTVWQATVGWEYKPTLGDLARFGLLSFQVLVHVQLALLLFFSALASASTISLEKDRRTFLLLLLTDLRNYEIVLGKVLGSLLNILLMLLGSVPVLALMMILGGVDPWQIVQTMLILAAAALTAGSLGGLVALWRDKTFQALAMTVLFLVLYLCLVLAIPYLPAALDALSIPADWLDSTTVGDVRSALDPFRALAHVLGDSEASDRRAAALRFGGAMLGLSVILNGIGIWRLRVWNPGGEPIMQREVIGATAAEPDRIHAAPGKARPVWANPVLWREIATRLRASALVVKAAYFVLLRSRRLLRAVRFGAGEMFAAWPGAIASESCADQPLSR